MKKKTKLVKAFTLAEVLITLGIIGIVAAITIPALNANTHKKELVSAYLKTINVLSNNFKQAESLKETKVNQLETQEEFKTWFEEHLKVVSRSPKCKYDVCLADGSGYSYNNDFVMGCTTDKTDGSSTNALKNSCISLMVDVNGAKGPNKDGKDRYILWVTKDGVFPEGLTDTCDGLNCGMYTLSTHKIWDDGTVLSENKTIADKNKDSIANCKANNLDTCQIQGVLLTKTAGIYATPKLDYSPIKSEDYDRDYWLAAKNTCENMGLSFPTVSQLRSLVYNGAIGGDTYWTSTNDSSVLPPIKPAYYVDEYEEYYNENFGSSAYNLVCVAE